MIVGNTLSEIGDILIIETNVSILGSFIQLTGYIENVIGETGTRFFDKKFRVSQDGLIFTDWETLNNTNISNVSGNVYNNVIYIQYRYERVGTDTTGLLEFISINLTGNVTISNFITTSVDNSIFKGLSVGNFVTAQLCSNLLQKLYEKGILPEYIVRTRNTDEDKDFIEFWSAICCYMAMFVTFVNRFETLYMERDLLLEYLKQMNVNFCDFEATLNDLQYISSKYLDEIRKRGTKQVFLRKNEILQDTSIVPVDGEVLRLFCTDECDEFLWTLRDLKNTGWNIGNSSPMYKGTNFDKNLSKVFEDTDIVQDVTKYERFSPNLLNNPIILDDKLRFATNLVPCGVGFEDIIITQQNLTVDELAQKGFVVNPNLDYEITFEIVCQTPYSITGSYIKFGCDAFDCDGNIYNLQEVENGTNSNTFIEQFNILKANTVYFVRGIVFRQSQGNISTQEKHLNICQGLNLRFSSQNIKRIMPRIEFKSATPASFLINKIKISPLRYNHSIGFLNTANIVEIFAKNNNPKLNFNSILEIIRRDLIPYNTVLMTQELN